MSANILCGPCGYEDNIKHAKKWCTNCEEGFCEDCEKVHRSTKMSRNHTLISVSDYQKIKDVVISQTCVGHGKRYELYCSVHDKPLCIGCVDQHKSCSQLVSLESVAANAKQSTALADLEDTINGALQNVGKFIKNQEKKDEEFDKQEGLIKKTIQKTRDKLNQHLDVLEQKLIQDLSTKTLNCKSTYDKTIHRLNLADQKLSQLKKETETMKQMASDVQVFIGTREINKSVSDEIQSVKGIIDRAKNFEIKIELDSTVKVLLNNVNQLGMISVDERKSELEFKDANLDQAQNQVLVSIANSNCVIDLELKESFDFSKYNRKKVSSCSILPNGHILIVDCLRNTQIMELDEQGQYVRFISCSGRPYYLTLINPDRIAVTYIGINTIDIINLTNTQVKKIPTTHTCCGISYESGKLFVVQKKKGIVAYDLSGNITNTLAIDTKHVMCIATAKDRIYYTNEQMNTIHCLSQRGEEMWKYQNESIISPREITVADNMDVFVVSSEDYTTSIIKHNGLESKILLKRTLGMIRARAANYNKNRRELLICNETGWTVNVYTVILG